jgi:RNA polymerase sigma-70 factor (ECF subfamily)
MDTAGGTGSSPTPASPTAPVDEAPGVPSPRDSELVAALRCGDEDSFLWLVNTFGPPMLRVARAHVPSTAIAEEVVQDTWVAALRGLDRFEGRSSLKTWLFGILLNIARTRGVRERRTVPFSDAFDGGTGPTVDPSRFAPPDAAAWPRHWTSPPASWADVPEVSLLSGEVRELVGDALTALPDRLRTVVTLRDVHGYSSQEVCDLLDLTAGNQRVLLHRGRAKIRAALEDYLEEHVEEAAQ